MAVVAVVKRRGGCGVTRQAVMGDTDNYRRRRQTEGPAKLKKKRWRCVRHTATGGSAANGAAPLLGRHGLTGEGGWRSHRCTPTQAQI